MFIIVHFEVTQEITTGVIPLRQSVATRPKRPHTTGTNLLEPNTTNNRPLFENLFENVQPRTSTVIHTPFNGTSPAPSDNMTETLMGKEG